MMLNQANFNHNLVGDVAGKVTGKVTAGDVVGTAGNLASAVSDKVAGEVTGNVASAVGTMAGLALETAKHIGTEVLSLFTMSNQKILESVGETHAHADDSVDVESLFSVVQNIVRRSTQIADNIVQGTQVHVETIDVKLPNTSFSSPLCTLKSIGCELSCKSPGEKIAYQSTLSILKKLSSYSWEAKAVLTLAAFALDYGEFWHLAQLQQTDPIAKSFAILKRVPVLLKQENLQKRLHAIIEVNNLIKTTLQVMENILKLEKYPIYNFKDVPAMAPYDIRVDVFWAIITIVACATKIDILISDEEKPDEDLSAYSQKIHLILNQLTRQLNICRRLIEEEKAYEAIKKKITQCTKIVDVFKALMFTKDIQQPLIICQTNETVLIDVLSGKHVLLFLSSLDVSDDDVNVLKKIHEEIKKGTKYCIVWIPIVENWTKELLKKFDSLRTKMPWYVVQYYSSIAGIRFIKEDWNFKAGSTVVKVMNPHAEILCRNAIHEFWLMGTSAFDIWEKGVYRLRPWIQILLPQIHPDSQTWIKEEKYIFFYGGKDNEWIERLTSKVEVFKEAKIEIKLCRVGKNEVAQFWTIIKSLYFSTISHQQQVQNVAEECQRLLSYKNEAGWALLTKGSTLVINGHGSIVLKVVEEFEKWKDQVVKKSFQIAFKDYYDKIYSSTIIPYCCRVDFPRETEGIPTTIKCTECHRAMEAFTTYKCCHMDGPLKEYH